MDSLECLFCHRRFPLDVFFPFCPDCDEPLLVRGSKKPRAFRTDKKLAIEVFRDFLPLRKIDPDLSLGEGDTPLIRLGQLMSKFDLPLVLAKNETVNPTSSFKDRGTVVAVQKAVALGLKRIGTISTGNMAGSTAAYAAKAGLQCVIFVKEDTTREKILAAGIYGPALFKVRGDYGRLFRKSFEIGRKYGIYFMNSVDPFRIEGYKATGFEIFLQLEARAPGYIIVPVSAGGHLIGLMRAFLDLKKEGMIRKMPVFIGVQARGCSPLARASASGKTAFSIFPNPRTIAHAISNPNPPGGNIVLKMIRENQGMMVGVTDAEILKAQKILAEEEGLFCDPASATVAAAFLRLAGRREWKSRDRIVLVITGSGLKTIEDLDEASIRYHEASLESLERKMSSVLS
ncbi:MAG: threonine synthase [Candidatus Aminicenantales bacterium]